MSFITFNKITDFFLNQYFFQIFFLSWLVVFLSRFSTDRPFWKRISIELSWRSWPHYWVRADRRVWKSWPEHSADNGRRTRTRVLFQIICDDFIIVFCLQCFVFFAGIQELLSRPWPCWKSIKVGNPCIFAIYVHNWQKCWILYYYRRDDA